MIVSNLLLFQTGSDSQFWALVGLFATLLIFLIRSEYTRWRDRQVAKDEAVKKELDRQAERQERIDAEKRVRLEREEIASKIKAEQREIEDKVRKDLERNASIIKQELEIHYAREMLELERSAFGVIAKLGAQEQVVKTLDSKVVTLIKADEHKNELKEAIGESVVAAKEAFEVANTINLKLEKMSESGLLNQAQEAGRAAIDQVEEKP